MVPANQSAMLRAPVPAQSLLVVASAMRVDWATRTRSRSCWHARIVWRRVSEFMGRHACSATMRPAESSSVVSSSMKDSVIEHVFDRQPPNQEVFTDIEQRRVLWSRQVRRRSQGAPLQSLLAAAL